MQMRYNITKSVSTKAERRLYEVLKSLKIDFKHRWKIGTYEVDFLVGNYVIEVNGHNQDPVRTKFMFDNGFTVVHLSNKEVKNNISNIKLWFKLIQSSLEELRHRGVLLKK